MLIKKSESKQVANSKTCIVQEYRFNSKILSFCTARINGRFPAKGRVANTECEELYYVISGSGMIHSELGDFEIKEGDIYHFNKGERFSVEGNNLFMAVTNSPKWFHEQHKEYD